MSNPLRLHPKENLDEMQLQIRNRIGNQSFLLLVYLLFLDIGLNGLGIQWLTYPMNVFIILLLCLYYNLIRTILAGAYIGPGAQSKNSRKRLLTIIATAGLGALIALTITLFRKGDAAPASDSGAVLLFTFSLVALLIAGLSILIVKARDKD